MKRPDTQPVRRGVADEATADELKTSDEEQETRRLHAAFKTSDIRAFTLLKTNM